MRYLGVDFGDMRTGLAVSDPSGFLATPLGTFTEPDLYLVAKKVLKTAAEQGAEKIILGYPRNMDGTVGERGHRTEKLRDAIARYYNGEVILWDERCTTISAHRALNVTNTRGKKRKAAIDTVSAVIILQSYLDGLK